MAKGPPSPEKLAQLIATHRGNLSAIAAAIGTVSRQSVTNWIRSAGLAETAAIERARGGSPGPRTLLAEGSLDAVGERSNIAHRVQADGTFTAAAAALGLSRRALYRRRKRLGIAT